MTIQKHGSRNSSIEVVKIIAIFLIITSHVVQTLGNCGMEYGFDISAATTNVQFLLISMLQYSGEFGNTIFFVCSAWFLIDSERTDKKKIFEMISDIWVISVLIALAAMVVSKGNISEILLIKSILPTTFSNNWYMTAYLIFYAIHPFINKAIKSMTQRSHLRFNLVAYLMYYLIPFVGLLTGHLFGLGVSFYSSRLIMWIILYSIIAYIKLYEINLANNKRINAVIIICGLIGNYGLILLTNILSFRFHSLSKALLLWYQPCNPFFGIIVIGLLNIAKGIHFNNKAINYISKLSLLIYVIHENIILRKFCRRMIWMRVLDTYGLNHLLLWVCILSLSILVFSIITSIIYRLLFIRLSHKFSKKIYRFIQTSWKPIEDKLLGVH